MASQFELSPQLENGYTKIANELLEALAAIRIPGESRQVLDVILRMSYGFKKKEASVTLDCFQKRTKLKKPNILRSLKKLVEMNIIVIRNDNSVIRNDNDKFATYLFNKTYKSWIPIKRQKPRGMALSETITTVIRNDNDRYPKRERRTIGKENLKKTLKKTNARRKKTALSETITAEAKKTVTPHGEFVTKFAEYYTKMTGNIFKADKKDFVIVHGLIKKYGLEQVQNKARILAVYCSGKITSWFAKDWSDFTIGALSMHWNRLLPRESEEQKIEREMQEHNRRINDILNADTNKPA